MDIKSFLLALQHDWVALMSGIASVVLTILGVVRRWDSLPRKALWIAALACFLLACCRIWTQEHRARLALEAQLQKLTIPKLEARIDAMSVGPLGQEGDADSFVTIAATIRNIGAPSIAELKSVTLDLNGHTYEGQTNVAIPGTIRLRKGYTDTPDYIELRQADYLPLKAMNAPIPTGGATSGFILVVFRGLTRDEIWPHGLIHVAFNDITGTPFKCDYQLPGSGGSDLIFLQNNMGKKPQ